MATNIARWSGAATMDANGFTKGVQTMERDSARAAKTVAQPFAELQRNISGKFEGLAKGIEGSFKNFSGGNLVGFMSAMKGGFAAAGISSAVSQFQDLAAALADWVKAGLDAIKMQDRLSKSLGTTHAGAAAMMAISSQAGQTPEELQSASMQGLRHIAELRNSLATGGMGGEAGSALRQLGIDPTAFATMRSWQDQLGLLGDRMRAMESAADRAGAAHAILGRGFEALLPQIMMGSEGMARLSSLADEFGVTVGQRATDSITGAGRAARQFAIAQQLAADGLRNSFAAALHDAVGGAANFEQRLQRLREMQPQLREAATATGTALGDLNRTVTGYMNELLAGWARVYNGIRGITPPATPRTPPAIPGQTPADAAAAASERAAERLAGARAIEERRSRELATAMSGFDIAAQERAQERFAMAMAETQAAQAALASIGPPPAITAPINLDANRAIDAATEAMRQQVNVYGLTANEATRLRAIQMGANAANLAEFDAMVEAQEKLLEGTRQQQRLAERSDRSEQMAVEARSPMQAFRARMREIEDAWIDPEAQARLAARAIQGLNVNAPAYQMPAAIDQGSAAALSLLNQARSGAGDNQPLSAREAVRLAAEREAADDRRAADLLAEVRNLRTEGEL